MPGDSHAIEPHCCYRFPAANGETDRPELKLATFVTPTSAPKRLDQGLVTLRSFFDAPIDRSPLSQIFRPRDHEPAISVFKALESRRKLGFQRR